MKRPVSPLMVGLEVDAKVVPRALTVPPPHLGTSDTPHQEHKAIFARLGLGTIFEVFDLRQLLSDLSFLPYRLKGPTYQEHVNDLSP